MTFGAILQAAAGPLAKRVLSSLGIGLVSFVGLKEGLDQALGYARASWTGMGGDIAAYLAMGGFNTLLSVLAGALIVRASLYATKSLKLL